MRKWLDKDAVQIGDDLVEGLERRRPAAASFRVGTLDGKVTAGVLKLQLDMGHIAFL